VYNKNGKVIASAVSNLDLHDISRAAKTYGVRGFYVVTPLEDQRQLVRRIVSHWTKGFGAAYNPDRRDALHLLRVVASMETVLDEISASGLGRPVTVATDARAYAGSISYKGLLERLESRRPFLLLFGTAWGLTRECIQEADYVLAPIKGPTLYNHLSVRSAAAIVLDRLLGTERV
jgi:hypothetical protein